MFCLQTFYILFCRSYFPFLVPPWLAGWQLSHWLVLDISISFSLILLSLDSLSYLSLCLTALPIPLWPSYWPFRRVSWYIGRNNHVRWLSVVLRNRIESLVFILYFSTLINLLTKYNKFLMDTHTITLFSDNIYLDNCVLPRFLIFIPSVASLTYLYLKY